MARVPSRDVRAVHAYAAAAALGLLVNLLVFGAGHLLGTSGYWDFPEADSQSNIVGYRYFLHEPWHWPLFEVRTMNAPFAKSIAMTDSVPPFAVLGKVIASVVPPWGPFSQRAFLGLWHGLSYALQACFGVACIRALGHRSWLAAASVSLVCLATPAFIFRYSHCSLSAHFFVLAALALYLRTPAEGPAPRRLRLWQCVQLLGAAMVNPYHLVVSFGLFAASLLRSRSWRASAPWLPAGCVVAYVGLRGGGFLSGEASLPMPGFEQGSTNLLAPFVPVRSVVFGDRRDIAEVFATPFQLEGYAYLGAGVLLLLALFVPHVRRVAGAVDRHRFLFLLVVGTWCFALSNHVYFGAHRLFTFEVPAPLLPLAHRFRAPGRFVWLPTYVLVIYLLHWALGTFVSGWRLLVVPAVTLLQVADGGVGDWQHRRAMTRRAFPHHLDLGVWRELVASHEAVQVEPSYECALDDGLDESVSRETHWAASLSGTAVNGVKSARASRDCAADAKLRETSAPRPRTLYVFHPRAVATATRFEATGVTCGEAFGFRACSTLDPVTASALFRGALRPVGGAAPVELGVPLSFDGPAIGRHLGTGWAPASSPGRWTLGETSTVIVRLEGSPPSRASLKIDAIPHLCGDRHTHDVDVALAGIAIGTLHYDRASGGERQVQSLELRETDLLRGGRLVLELRPRDHRTLHEAGCGDEAAIVTLLVHRVWFE